MHYFSNLMKITFEDKEMFYFHFECLNEFVFIVNFVFPETYSEIFRAFGKLYLSKTFRKGLTHFIVIESKISGRISLPIVLSNSVVGKYKNFYYF